MTLQSRSSCWGSGSSSVLSCFPACLQAQSTQQAKNATLTVTGAVSWRRPGLKYSKNEVFLDIVEEVNLLMSSTGVLLWQLQDLTQRSSSGTLQFGRSHTRLVQSTAAHSAHSSDASSFSGGLLGQCQQHFELSLCGGVCGVAGAVLRNDVVGRIMMKCLLSDMPELRLGLNEKIEDITFHQVYRQTRG